MHRWKCPECNFVFDVTYATLAHKGNPVCVCGEDMVLLPIPTKPIFVVTYTYEVDNTDVFLFPIFTNAEDTEKQVTLWIERRQSENWGGLFHIHGAQDFETYDNNP
jgi:hypothetical protein